MNSNKQKIEAVRQVMQCNAMGNYYKMLGVSENASPKIISLAYKTMCLLLHPDKNSKKDAAEAFLLISKAKEVLLDENKREEYDMTYREPNRREKINRNFSNYMRNQPSDSIVEFEEEGKIRRRHNKEMIDPKHRKKMELLLRREMARDNKMKRERERYEKSACFYGWTYGSSMIDEEASDEEASNDDEASDAKASNVEVSNKEASDEETSDAKASNVEVSNKEASDERASDKEASDEEASDDEASDEEASDEENKNMKAWILVDVNDAPIPTGKKEKVVAPKTKKPGFCFRKKGSKKNKRSMFYW